jgi:phosphoglycolate phosphatase-like HAD superfamily hydrolase
LSAKSGANGANGHAGEGPEQGPRFTPHADLSRVRAVIFDVDGVLLDARPSYHAAAEEGARRSVAIALGEARARALPFDRAAEIAQFKAAGGFNDDWEMSRAIAHLLLLRAKGGAGPTLAEVLARSGGRGVAGLVEAYGAAATEGLGPAALAALEPAWFSRVCGALYAGVLDCKKVYGFDAREVLPEAPERGFYERETPLCDPKVLAEVEARWALSLFTGRYPAEAELALRVLRLDVNPRIRWTADGVRPRKPDPAGLIWLCEDLLEKKKRGTPQAETALFLGDTADDQAAAKAAQDAGAPLIYAHIEQPGDTTRALQRLIDQNTYT